jgi:hypothetical protein
VDKQDRLKNYATRISGRGIHEAMGLTEGVGDPVPLLIDATPLAKNDEEREIAARAHAKLMNDQRLDERETNIYEAIVVPTERPALIVSGGLGHGAPRRRRA